MALVSRKRILPYLFILYHCNYPVNVNGLPFEGNNEQNSPDERKTRDLFQEPLDYSLQNLRRNRFYNDLMERDREEDNNDLYDRDVDNDYGYKVKRSVDDYFDKREDFDDSYGIDVRDDDDFNLSDDSGDFNLRNDEDYDDLNRRDFENDDFSLRNDEDDYFSMRDDEDDNFNLRNDEDGDFNLRDDLNDDDFDDFNQRSFDGNVDDFDARDYDDDFDFDRDANDFDDDFNERNAGYYDDMDERDLGDDLYQREAIEDDSLVDRAFNDDVTDLNSFFDATEREAVQRKKFVRDTATTANPEKKVQSDIKKEHERAEKALNKTMTEQQAKQNKDKIAKLKEGQIQGEKRLLKIKNNLVKSQNDFLFLFNKFPAESIPWVEPKLLPNCFAQAMLASNNKYFGPSCNRDGTFAPKQCHLERCWCVTRTGEPVEKVKELRFKYLMEAIILTCSQNEWGIPGLQNSKITF